MTSARHRQVVAIALVAAALCADRAVTAAPVLRPCVSGVAGKLVQRLSTRFRQVVPAARVYEARRDVVEREPLPLASSHTTAGFRPRLSPLITTLPPPLA